MVTIIVSNGGSWSPKRCIFPVVSANRGRSVFTLDANRPRVCLKATRSTFKTVSIRNRIRMSLVTSEWRSKLPLNQKEKKTLVCLKQIKCVRCEDVPRHTGSSIHTHVHTPAHNPNDESLCTHRLLFSHYFYSKLGFHLIKSTCFQSWDALAEMGHVGKQLLYTVCLKCRKNTITNSSFPTYHISQH